MEVSGAPELSVANIPLNIFIYVLSEQIHFYIFGTTWSWVIHDRIFFVFNNYLFYFLWFYDSQIL